ncbi:hypothetical protein NFI95_03605 [Acetobacteraceae bacterium KSS8]|uniref:YMGG-like Gly-zipper domain-containing protein n=1 Tax=Endosaccharibacter trunci TaxID=2812733 RepID=A0ABT1W3U0_9PROT|nr:hypothetical protein [Acetobacteraceae bacterium KSS8]
MSAPLMRATRVVRFGKALPLLVLAATTALAGCTDPYDPGQRAVGGGLLGAGTGAALGAIAGGGRGAAIGALAGTAVGAVGGAATTPYRGGPSYGGYASPAPAQAPVYVQPTYVQPTYVAPAPVYVQPAYPAPVYAAPPPPPPPSGYAY